MWWGLWEHQSQSRPVVGGVPSNFLPTRSPAPAYLPACKLFVNNIGASVLCQKLNDQHSLAHVIQIRYQQLTCQATTMTEVLAGLAVASSIICVVQITGTVVKSG
jgi:hypothetical protein